MAEKIYTLDLAAKVLEQFENVLEKQDVTLTSPEDDDKEQENGARLYGSTYSELLDAVEDIFVDILKKAKISEEKYVSGEFSGRF